MSNFKIHYKRNRFKSNGDKNFRKRNNNGHKINGEFNANHDFKRKNPGKNNQNAARLIDKYKDLAREALSNGDKILSENYLQHADHFARILQMRELTKELNLNSSNSLKINSEDKEQAEIKKDDSTKTSELNYSD